MTPLPTVADALAVLLHADVDDVRAIALAHGIDPDSAFNVDVFAHAVTRRQARTRHPSWAPRRRLSVVPDEEDS